MIDERLKQKEKHVTTIMVLDHVRRQITRKLCPELSDAMLEAKANSTEVNERVREYAENMIFGFDFDPDLKKAAKMNMVMAGDSAACDAKL